MIFVMGFRIKPQRQINYIELNILPAVPEERVGEDGQILPALQASRARLLLSSHRQIGFYFMWKKVIEAEFEAVRVQRENMLQTAGGSSWKERGRISGSAYLTPWWSRGINR